MRYTVNSDGTVSICTYESDPSTGEHRMVEISRHADYQDARREHKRTEKARIRALFGWE